MEQTGEVFKKSYTNVPVLEINGEVINITIIRKGKNAVVVENIFKKPLKMKLDFSFYTYVTNKIFES